MIKVPRRQTAGKEHTCDECGGPIRVGQQYDRIAQFESWADVGMGEPKALFSDTATAHEFNAVWKEIVASPEVLILKVHGRVSDCVALVDAGVDYGPDYDRERGE